MNNNDVSFGSTFPYLGLPHPGSNTGPGGLGGPPRGLLPNSGVNSGAGGTAAPASSQTPALPLAAGLAGLVLAGGGVLLLRRSRAQ